MADQTLVQGAGLVAQTKGAGKLSAAVGLASAGAHIAKGTAVTIKRNNKEFNEIMKAELAREPGLTDEAYKKKYKEIKKKRFKIV